MSEARTNFRIAYRAARAIMKHRILAQQEAKRHGDSPFYKPALHCALRRHDWKFGIQASRSVRRAGRSASKCIEINLRAVRFRRQNRWAFGNGGFNRWAAQVAA